MRKNGIGLKSIPRTIQNVKMMEQEICKVFNVKSFEYVSKNQLAAHVLHKRLIEEYLLEELFYADPNHPVFLKVPERGMSALRTKTIIRHGVKSWENEKEESENIDETKSDLP